LNVIRIQSVLGDAGEIGAPGPAGQIGPQGQPGLSGKDVRILFYNSPI